MKMFPAAVLLLLLPLLAGCNLSPNPPLHAPTEGIKISDLKPAYTESAKQSLNLTIALFEVPAEKVPALEEAYKLLNKDPLTFYNRRLFEQNDLFAGMGNAPAWDSFYKNISSCGAKMLITEQLFFFENSPQQIPIRVLATEQYLSYTGSDETNPAQKLPPGQLLLQLCPSGTMILPGLAEIVIEPRLQTIPPPLFLNEKPNTPARQNQYDTILAIAKFSAPITQENFVVLGPTRYHSIDTLNGILFNIPRTTTAILLYVIFCSGTAR